LELIGLAIALNCTRIRLLMKYSLQSALKVTVVNKVSSFSALAHLVHPLALGSSFGPLGSSFGPLGSSFGPLGSSFGPLGSSFGPLGSSFGPLGQSPFAYISVF
jgi:hypothetical protein